LAGAQSNASLPGIFARDYGSRSADPRDTRVVADRKDLQAKLAAASDWVRAEFNYIIDTAAGLGCQARLESGPGLAFRIDVYTIARAHPKLSHIAVGLPDWMRAEVQALTDALRAQQGFAWFNYGPKIGDRDTIDLLLSTSRDAIHQSVARLVPTRGQKAPPGPTPAQRTGGKPERDDEAHLTLVLAVLRAFKRHAETTGLPSALKPIREAIFLQWEGPRLPSGGKYSRHLPHSPAARRQRAARRRGELVYEHVVPISIVIGQMLLQLPSGTAGLRAALEATADRVIITSAENAALTAAGVRDAIPDTSDPWSRYRALGLEKSDFTPLA
jgi:hypothetical protein